MLLQITSLCGTDLLKHCNKNVTCALFRNRHFQINSKLPVLKLFLTFLHNTDMLGVPPAQLIVQQ